MRSRLIFDCPSEKNTRNDNPRAAGYTDYWYNLNSNAVCVRNFKSPSQTLMLGDGDGGSKNSNARYAIRELPKSWWTTAGSPARRHLDGGNYAFVDGHVKWFKPSSIGGKDATFAVK